MSSPTASCFPDQLKKAGRPVTNSVDNPQGFCYYNFHLYRRFSFLFGCFGRHPYKGKALFFRAFTISYNKYYTPHGFQFEGRPKDYYGKGGDQIVFEKDLSAIPNPKPGRGCKRFEVLERGMTKEQLADIIIGLLDTDLNLQFLLQLRKDDLETLVACIRDRVDQTRR